MSGIAGFFHPDFIFQKENEQVKNTIENMSLALRRRGPDRQEFYYFPHGCMNHNALACGSIHPQIPCEPQPATRKFNGQNYTIMYDGFIANLPELREELQRARVITDGLSQEELLLCAFLQYGTDFVKKLSGAFAIAIYDERNNRMYLFRDPLGLRPLFYTVQKQVLVFASEPKALLQYPGVEPVVDAEGLNELLSMGPAHTPGHTVYRDILELKPGHMLISGKGRFYTERYHQFTIKEHTDSYEDTVAHVRELLDHSIQVAASANAPYASLLSGGLDSSLLSSLANQVMQEQGRELHTFSVDYQDNDRYFQKSHFQPTSDPTYIRAMERYLGCRHHWTVLDTPALAEALYAAVDARDLPGMVDVDSSLLLFCREIRQEVTVALSGECADELFGGYPWYRDADIRRINGFPWAQSTAYRTQFLLPEIAAEIDAQAYVQSAYARTVAAAEKLPDDSPLESRMREMMKLNLDWFMQTLLDRKDRMSMYNALEVRVPFCDYRIAEYLYNVPWEYKDWNGY